MKIIKIIFVFLMLLFLGYLIKKIYLLKDIKENQHMLAELNDKQDTHLDGLAKLDPDVDKSLTVVKEGFFGSSTINSEYKSVTNSNVIAGITNSININLPIKEYCIKASYNSALTGSYINLDMIKYVLSRGCRFLDFEIYSFDNVPYVAYSTDNTFSNIKTLNKLPLKDVLESVVINGFNAPSPNPKDPLFIHLRIKTNNNKLYEQIALIVDVTIKQKLYKSKLSPNTYLSDLMNKIILIIDKKLTPDYAEYPECIKNCISSNNILLMNSSCPNCYSLKNYVNAESGTSIMRIYNYSYIIDQSYTSPEVMDDGKSTTVDSIKIVLPDNGTNLMGIVRNPSYYNLPSNYGVQIVLYPFYQNDMYLNQYEEAFSDNSTAFVPLYMMLKYVNQVTNSLQG